LLNPQSIRSTIPATSAGHSAELLQSGATSIRTISTNYATTPRPIQARRWRNSHQRSVRRSVGATGPSEPVVVSADDVLLFDGLFLQRTELVEYWDFVIFVDGKQSVNLQRLGLIFADLPEGSEEIVSHTLEWASRIGRYSAGMRYYVDLVDPTAHPDIAIDNSDLSEADDSFVVRVYDAGSSDMMHR